MPPHSQIRRAKTSRKAIYAQRAPSPETSNEGQFGLFLCSLGQGRGSEAVEHLRALDSPVPELAPVVRFVVENPERLLVLRRVVAEDQSPSPGEIDSIVRGAQECAEFGLLPYLVAVVLQRGGQLDAAERLYRTALSLAPELEMARIGLATTLIRAGHDAEARRHLEQILDDPETGSASKGLAHLGLGLIAAAQAHWEEALLHFERGEAQGPDDPHLRPSARSAHLARASALARYELATSDEAVDVDRPKYLRMAFRGFELAAGLYVLVASSEEGKLASIDWYEQALICLHSAHETLEVLRMLSSNEQLYHIEGAALLRRELAEQLGKLLVSAASGRGDSGKIQEELLRVLDRLGTLDELLPHEHMMFANTLLAARPGSSSIEAAIEHSELAVEATLGHDLECVQFLGRLYAGTGRYQEARATLEEGVAECRKMWGEGVGHRWIDELESGLLLVFRKQRDHDSIAALIDERAGRASATDLDIVNAIILHLDEEHANSYDPKKARELARSMVASSAGASATGELAASFVALRTKDLVSSLDSLDRAFSILDSLRILDSDDPEVQKKGRARAEFSTAVLVLKSALDPGSETDRLWGAKLDRLQQL